MKFFITGGAGFIGSNFIRHLLREHPDCTVVNFDALTYAGNLDNLRDVEKDPRYRFVRGDICRRVEVAEALERGTDVVVNFAAETHVDRSIEDPERFVLTNVVGVQVLLDVLRERGVGRFIQVSTDEVMGSLGPRGYFTEESALCPNSPYAASKAAAELLVRAARHTFGTDAIIVRAGNNYGPYQFPEKLIPLMITNALADRPLPVYGDGMNVRDWIYVEDYCRALDRIVHRGRAGDIYCVGARSEKTNLEVVEMILAVLGKPRSLIRFVEDRPGHDRRYAIDPSKVEREFDWRPEETFESGLRKTVAWYQANTAWVENVRRGEYLRYYERHYGWRKGMR